MNNKLQKFEIELILSGLSKLEQDYDQILNPSHIFMRAKIYELKQKLERWKVDCKICECGREIEPHAFPNVDLCVVCAMIEYELKKKITE